MPSATDIIKQMQAAQLRDKLSARNVPPGRNPRNTYSEKHAYKLGAIITKALTERTDVCIPYSTFPGCAPKRVYSIVADSVLWHVYNAEPEDLRPSFATMRSQIRYEMSTDPTEGIWIRWRTQEQPGRQRMLAGVAAPSCDYIEILHEWICGDRAKPFVVRGLNLSIEQQQAVAKIFESACVANYKVLPDRITAIAGE